MSREGCVVEHSSGQSRLRILLPCSASPWETLWKPIAEPAPSTFAAGGTATLRRVLAPTLALGTREESLLFGTTVIHTASCWIQVLRSGPPLTSTIACARGGRPLPGPMPWCGNRHVDAPLPTLRCASAWMRLWKSKSQPATGKRAESPVSGMMAARIASCLTAVSLAGLRWTLMSLCVPGERYQTSSLFSWRRTFVGVLQQQMCSSASAGGNMVATSSMQWMMHFTALHGCSRLLLYPEARSIRVLCPLGQAKVSAWAQPPFDLLTAGTSSIASTTILPVLAQTSVQGQTLLQVAWNGEPLWIRETDSTSDLVKFPHHDVQGHIMLRNSDGRGKVAYYLTWDETQRREMPHAYIEDGTAARVQSFDLARGVDGYAFAVWFDKGSRCEGYVKQCHVIKLQARSVAQDGPSHPPVAQDGPRHPPAAQDGPRHPPAALPAPACVLGCGRRAAPGYDTCCRTCSQSGTTRHGPQCEHAFTGGAAMPMPPQTPPQALIPRCPHAGFAASVFVSHHNTANSQLAVSLWLGEQMLRPGFSAIASAPRFNTSSGDYERFVTKLNVPCYSPQLTEAVMRIFTDLDVASISQEMGVQIPSLTLNPTFG